MTDVALCTRTSGEATHGTIVFVHGLGESSLGFDHLGGAPELEGWRLLAPDLPGYGRTPPVQAGHKGLADHAETLGRWLRVLGLGPVVLVGHSMGGVVGLLLAERHPDLLRGFFEVEGNVTAADCVYSDQFTNLNDSDWAGDGPARVRDRVYRLGQNDPAHRLYFASLSFADATTLRTDAADLVALSVGGDLAERRARLTLPFAYLLGSPRGAGAESQAALTAAGVPWSAVAPAGHWPFVDQPRAFLGQLAGFLARA